MTKIKKRPLGMCSMCKAGVGPQELIDVARKLCSAHYQQVRKQEIRDTVTALKITDKQRNACWQRLHAAGCAAKDDHLFSAVDFSIFRDLIDPILPHPAPGREMEVEVEKLNGATIYYRDGEYFTSLERDTIFDDIQEARDFIIAQTGLSGE